MNTVTKTYTTYQFSELEDDAKETARAWYREGAFDYDWHEYVIEDAKTIGALMGIDVDKIYFSGFSSQGDGACFEGHYAYKKGSVKAVKEYAPQDKTLHVIAQGLAEVQRKNFYQLYANVKQSGHYMHEMCTDIDVRTDYDYYGMTEYAVDGIEEFLRDFMRWIYSSLEAEFDYLNSDSQVDWAIEANEYEFMEDGSIAN